MIQLERYKGTKSRHTCPSCGARQCFARYVREDGSYFAPNVGRCNRESKCGYHYPPKQFFADNPQAEKLIDKSVSIKSRKPKYLKTSPVLSTNVSSVSTPSASSTVSQFIPFEHFKPTLLSGKSNAFAEFLFELFSESVTEVELALRSYFVGSYEGFTSFPRIDGRHRIRTVKLMKFDSATGKRLKTNYSISSLSYELKKRGLLGEDFHSKPCFFGEHMLEQNPGKTVAITESEKSAVIASICFPKFVWLAAFNKSWLKAERLRRFQNRKIILYPDSDGFSEWGRIAQDARRQGIDVNVSTLIETHATAEQKASGADLADYLINQQTEINRVNDGVDSYNTKLDAVLNSSLKWDVETILDEQKAIAIYNGLPETEAEEQVTTMENMRAVIESVSDDETFNPPRFQKALRPKIERENATGSLNNLIPSVG